MYVYVCICIYMRACVCIYTGNGNPLQYSCLENSMDRRAWRATVHARVRHDVATKQQHRLWGWGRPVGSSPGWDVGLHCQGLLAMSPQPESKARENNWRPVVGKAVFLGVPLRMASSTLYQWNLILCQLPKEERLKGQLNFQRLGNKGWIWGWQAINW